MYDRVIYQEGNRITNKCTAEVQSEVTRVFNVHFEVHRSRVGERFRHNAQSYNKYDV